ncbi:MAG: LuxR C-terminal-related transcriptional regulator [Sporichthyaceae bacterium]
MTDLERQAAAAPRRGRPLSPTSVEAVADLLAQVAAATGEPLGCAPADLDASTAQAALLAAWDTLRGVLTDRASSAGEVEALLDLLERLRTLSDELRDEQWRERERSFERVRETLALLRDIESSAELIDQAVVAVCELGFDRAIVSRVENNLWVAQSVYVGRDVRWAQEILEASQQNPQAIEDVPEAEIVRTGRSVLVPTIDDQTAVHRPIAETSKSRGYVAAPIVAHGAVVGFLHADCYYQGRSLDETDRAILALFGEGLGYALARTAVLDRLAALHEDLGKLGRGANRLWPQGEGPAPTRRMVSNELGDGGLTRREIDVLGWMARGETNARIARRLAITEGTVKTHVQSILRKLGAANRAEAVSLWTRMQQTGRS